MSVDPPSSNPDKYGVNTYRTFKVGDRVTIRSFVYQGSAGRPDVAGREADVLMPTQESNKDRFYGHKPHVVVRVCDARGLSGSDAKSFWIEEGQLDLVDKVSDEEERAAIASITGKAIPRRAAIDMAPLQIAHAMHLLDRVAEAIYCDGDQPEWLTTVDGSPNSASYEYARRALKALGE